MPDYLWHQWPKQELLFVCLCWTNGCVVCFYTFGLYFFWVTVSLLLSTEHNIKPHVQTQKLYPWLNGEGKKCVTLTDKWTLVSAHVKILNWGSNFNSKQHISRHQGKLLNSGFSFPSSLCFISGLCLCCIFLYELFVSCVSGLFLSSTIMVVSLSRSFRMRLPAQISATQASLSQRRMLLNRV